MRTNKNQGSSRIKKINSNEEDQLDLKEERLPREEERNSEKEDHRVYHSTLNVSVLKPGPVPRQAPYKKMLSVLARMFGSLFLLGLKLLCQYD